MKLKQFSDLVGKTLVKVEGQEGDDVLAFHLDDGSVASLYHSQDCCESVSIEDIAGDLTDLVGSPIVRAEENEGADREPLSPHEDSYTWTFYRIATAKGLVVIRWYGSSNGYYSESVYFEHIGGK